LNGLENKIKKQIPKPPTVVLEHRLLFKKVTSLQAATNSKHIKDLSKREVPQRIQSVPLKSLETPQDQELARSQKKINHGTNYLKKTRNLSWQRSLGNFEEHPRKDFCDSDPIDWRGRTNLHLR
jgi:hypothetical protein